MTQQQNKVKAWLSQLVDPNEKIFSKSESATKRIAFITDDGTLGVYCGAQFSQ